MISEVQAEILAKVEELSQQHDIDLDENLFEVGILTSIHVVDLITFIEGRFEVSVPVDQLSVDNFSSVGAMAAFTQSILEA
jgi:acyl carrier protein